jgi:C-terminal processing protease CtpA/Prc
MKSTKLKNLRLVSQVYDKILEIYPFLTVKEKADYIKQAKLITKNDILIDQEPIKCITRLLAMLHNGHADVRIKRPKRLKRDNYFRSKTYGNILYLQIKSWPADPRFEKQLNDSCRNLAPEIRGIIVDVRDNQGGNSFVAHKFAAIFFKKLPSFGTFTKNEKGVLKKFDFILPEDPGFHLDMPLVLLINHKCFSSNELFIAPFKISGRATLIGEKTGGGSGNPLYFDVESDGVAYTVRIPRWRFFLKGETRPIEETAINPDIIYKKQDIVNFAINTLLKTSK